MSSDSLSLFNKRLPTIEAFSKWNSLALFNYAYTSTHQEPTPYSYTMEPVTSDTSDKLRRITLAPHPPSFCYEKMYFDGVEAHYLIRTDASLLGRIRVNRRTMLCWESTALSEARLHLRWPSYTILIMLSSKLAYCKYLKHGLGFLLIKR